MATVRYPNKKEEKFSAIADNSKEGAFRANMHIFDCDLDAKTIAATVLKNIMLNDDTGSGVIVRF
jgi:hypothetical protein